MSDLADVRRARQEAADALNAVLNYGGQIEEGREGDLALAVLLAAGAVCAELSALNTTLDYSANALSRP